jgi:hypothetical protein
MRRSVTVSLPSRARNCAALATRARIGVLVTTVPTAGLPSSMLVAPKNPLGPMVRCRSPTDDQVDLAVQKDPESVVVLVLVHERLARVGVNLVQVGGNYRELAPRHVLEERRAGEPADLGVLAVLGQSVKELGHRSAHPFASTCWPDDDDG